MKQKSKTLKITAVLLALTALLTGGGLFWYSAICYAPDAAAQAALVSSSQVTVENRKHCLVFRPEQYDTGLIFYPGGSVNFEAYAPLMHALAEKGILTILPEMPLDLAVLDMDAAEGIPEQFPEVRSWYLGGHSLGGSMAASYAAQSSGYTGLVLLAAYSVDDLSDSGMRVLSIYGTRDQVLDRERYRENFPNLPQDTTELVLEGGNHAQFGSYGSQKGDGVPEISPEAQLLRTVETVRTWMDAE